MATRKFCGLLRTKTAYYRTPDGERRFDPDSTTACYTCLLTQRPFGPDGEPADADSCGENRGCYEEER
ncbi:MAG TPA: hypothetical protein VMV27_00950 [Candidatus Binataceae bacterium]|nr:hypothetical protein [Candidatus Binataceae bacterium]